MKGYLVKILTTMVIAVVFITNAYAQNDTLSNLQLFSNAASNDAKNDTSSRQLYEEVDTVTEQLNTLQTLYSTGKYGRALLLARDMNNSHLTKSQNLLRLKYNIASFKALEYHREADSAAQLFLQKDPFYSVGDNDPVPFREVLENYYTMPQFSLWASMGMMYGIPVLDTVRTIVDTLSCEPEYDITCLTLQIGFEYRPFKILTVFVAPTFASYNIERSINRTDIAVFRYKETCQVISLPLCIEASLYRQHEVFVPSVYVGAQLKYIIQSKYSAQTEAIGVYADRPNKYVDTDSKNRINYSILTGVRLSYIHRRITFFADLGMGLDLKSFNNPSKKYDNFDLFFQHLHIPDTYRMMDFWSRGGVKINLHYKTIAKYNYGH